MMRNPKWFFEMLKLAIVFTIFFWIAYSLWKALMSNF